MRAHYPVTGWVRTVLNSKQKMNVSLLYAHVVFKPYNMVISRFFVEYGREMHGNSCCSCSTSIFPYLTNNILAQWRSRSRRLCLNSLFSLIAGSHSRDQQPCFSTKTKGSVCIIIELNSRRIWSGHQHGRLFFV